MNLISVFFLFYINSVYYKENNFLDIIIISIIYNLHYVILKLYLKSNNLLLFCKVCMKNFRSVYFFDHNNNILKSLVV